ncbi:hypothetical protein [Bosea sp. ASV33]|uniref:hypothetical protein n=1 Tax=Bosea sp. ASV33 TaxID=2795106 RepID=UPI0018EC677E|nr:hypothetical protein [Bosea sp. ASV33]
MINPAIMGPAAGMVVGGICYVAFVGFSFWRWGYIPTDGYEGLAVGAFCGGFLGYKSVAWLGLVAP